MPFQSHVQPQAPGLSRLAFLDRFRGLVMVLMALDHASLFVAKIHPGEFWGAPLPEYSDALSFWTRYVTHLCAPGFFLLMGAGMILFADTRRSRGWSNQRIRRYFLARGGILILLQHTVENPAWLLGTLAGPIDMPRVPGGGGEVWLHFGVLYALGAAMMVWAVLLSLRPAVAAALSIGGIVLSGLFVPEPAMGNTLYSPWLRLLLIPGRTEAWQVLYPLLPWAAIAGLGTVFARGLAADAGRTRKVLGAAGPLLLGGFVLARALGMGDFHPPGEGWMAALTVTKYPPSPAYLLVTLGTACLLLFLLWRLGGEGRNEASPLLVFGETALFFYLGHLYLYALLGWLLPQPGNLLAMIPVWVLGLLLLYPICRSYRSFRRRLPVGSWRRLV